MSNKELSLKRLREIELEVEQFAYLVSDCPICEKGELPHSEHFKLYKLEEQSE